MSSLYTNARITHSEDIERAVDEIVETILSDSNVSTDPNSEDAPVSSETWLATKTVILKLLARIAEEE